MGDRAGGISSRSADAGAESVMAATLGQAGSPVQERFRVCGVQVLKCAGCRRTFLGLDLGFRVSLDVAAWHSAIRFDRSSRSWVQWAEPKSWWLGLKNWGSGFRV